MKIIPSILNANFGHIAKAVKEVEAGGASRVHIDVMDGMFVPNLSFGPQIVTDLRKETNIFIEVHLMVSNPEKWIKVFAEAGADCILMHFESTTNIRHVLTLIKEYKIKAGIVINPDTPVEAIVDVLPFVNQVLVMTVYPGFGGQKLIINTLSKIDTLEKIKINDSRCKFVTEIDGGVHLDTLKFVMGHHIDFAVAGSAIYKSDHPAKKLQKLQELVTDS